MTDETVTDVVRDFDAMAAECGGLEAATIHAMTTRIQAAHAREVERAVANERVRDVHTCHDQCTKTELCRMTRRAEAAEAILDAASECHPSVGDYQISKRPFHVIEDDASDRLTEWMQARAIASGGEE